MGKLEVFVSTGTRPAIGVDAVRFLSDEEITRRIAELEAEMGWPHWASELYERDGTLQEDGTRTYVVRSQECSDCGYVLPTLGCIERIHRTDAGQWRFRDGTLALDQKQEREPPSELSQWRVLQSFEDCPLCGGAVVYRRAGRDRHG